jgi:urease accessory protein
MSQIRPLRVGVAGPVGTGKSSLVAATCGALNDRLQIGVITNDIYTDEDARFLRSAGVLPDERIVAVQTGCCPHTAIRDDVSENLNAADELDAASGPLDVIFVESGGDNLTATFSPALADVQIFVLDCAGGDDVPRKGGPGIARSDLLVINKIDLAPYVGSDVERMVSDSRAARDGRAVLAISLRQPRDVERVAEWVLDQLAAHRAGALVSHDPGPMAPHHHPERGHTEHGSHAHVH